MNDLSSSSSIPQQPAEVWKPIPGYEGIYEISDLGRIRSVVKRMRTQIGDIIHGSRLKIGYCYARLTNSHGVKKRHFVHRLVLMTFHPHDNADALDANHLNGIRHDNRLENLEWLSHRDNILYSLHVLKTFRANQPAKKERVQKGRAKGATIGTSKLDDAKVREIRRLYKSGTPQKAIAQQFQITQTTVSLIVNRKQWAHVD